MINSPEDMQAVDRRQSETRRYVCKAVLASLIPVIPGSLIVAHLAARLNKSSEVVLDQTQPVDPAVAAYTAEISEVSEKVMVGGLVTGGMSVIGSALLGFGLLRDRSRRIRIEAQTQVKTQPQDSE